MGVNDAQEMLEAAQAECIRLERELAKVKAECRDMVDAQIVRGNSLAEQLAAALAVLDQVRRLAERPLSIRVGSGVMRRSPWRPIQRQEPTVADDEKCSDV